MTKLLCKSLLCINTLAWDKVKSLVVEYRSVRAWFLGFWVAATVPCTSCAEDHRPPLYPYPDSIPLRYPASPCVPYRLGLFSWQTLFSTGGPCRFMVDLLVPDVLDSLLGRFKLQPQTQPPPLRQGPGITKAKSYLESTCGCKRRRPWLLEKIVRQATVQLFSVDPTRTLTFASCVPQGLQITRLTPRSVCTTSLDTGVGGVWCKFPPPLALQCSVMYSVCRSLPSLRHRATHVHPPHPLQVPGQRGLQSVPRKIPSPRLRW